MPTFHVVCEFIPKDAKNEQKPGANSSGGAHLVIGDGLRHFLLCSIIASDSIAYTPSSAGPAEHMGTFGMYG